jgi:hypothetical protein
MPVFYCPYIYPTDAPRAVYKASVIHKLKESAEFGEVLVGVGDRPSDMQAYAQNGLTSLIVADSLGECLEASGDPSAQRKMLQDAEHKLTRADVEYYTSTPDCSAWMQIQQRLILMANERSSTTVGLSSHT